MDEQEKPPVKRQAARITHHEIKAMKAVEAIEPPAHIVLLNKFKTFFTDLQSSFGSIFANKEIHDACAVNGHVFPKGEWDGAYPHCTHCGKEIHSADEMGTR
jgi:hypothetical protein